MDSKFMANNPPNRDYGSRCVLCVTYLVSVQQKNQ